MDLSDILVFVLLVLIALFMVIAFIMLSEFSEMIRFITFTNHFPHTHTHLPPPPRLGRSLEAIAVEI